MCRFCPTNLLDVIRTGDHERFDITADLQARAERLRAAVSQAGVTATSADHLVHVTMAPGNAVTALELAPQAVRHRSGAALAETIRETIEDARRQLAESMASLVAELAPNQENAAAALGPLTGSLGSVVDRSWLDTTATGDEAAEDVPEPELPPEWADRPGMRELAESLQAVERLQAEARRQREAATRYFEQVDRVTGSATSADGSVTVTMGPQGEVRSITIDDGLLRHGPKHVSSTVLATIQHAQADLAMRLAEYTKDLLGSQLDIQELVKAHLPEGFEESER